MHHFQFDELQSHPKSNTVPLSLYRSIRLIGMREGLIGQGNATTRQVGTKIGETIQATDTADLLKQFEAMDLGKFEVVKESVKEIVLDVRECFCDGLPPVDEKVCDLEGAILEGALSKMTGRRVRARETMCHAHGDPHCRYEVSML